MSPFSVTFAIVVCSVVIVRTSAFPVGIFRLVGPLQAYFMGITLLAPEETTKLLALVGIAVAFGGEVLIRRHLRRAAAHQRLR